MKPRNYTKLSKGLHNIRLFIIRPEFFIFIGFAYLLASTAAALDPFMLNLNSRISGSLLTFLVFLFGLLCFYFGLRTSKHALKLKYAPIIGGVVVGTIASDYILNLGLLAAIGINLLAILLSYILLFSKLRHGLVFAGGAFVFWINFAMNGIPILDVQTHTELFTMVNPLFVIGFFFMLYSAARLFPQKRYLWLFLVFSAFLSTYRIYAGIAFITWALLELKNFKFRNKGVTDQKKIILIVLLVAALFIFSLAFIYLGHSIMSSSYGSWSLGPIRTLEYRLALTMGVFDDIVKLSWPFGYTGGRSITMEATEFTCRVLYGCDTRITSTAFGQAMLDFGLLGVYLVSFWVAVVLARLFRHDYPLYTILFASLIASLDVGINIFLVLEYIYLGWVSLMREWK